MAGCNKKEKITTAAIAVHILWYDTGAKPSNIAGKKSYTCISLKIRAI
jgi:hypothetical protein